MSARAHFCSDSFKTKKNACNIHNSEFACKKSASYDISKLCLNSKHCLNFLESNTFRPPPLYSEQNE